MNVFIIYFILMANSKWEFVAVDPEPNSVYYCQMLKEAVAERFENKIGNMKVICAIGHREDI